MTLYKNRGTITLQTINELLSNGKQRKSHAGATAWLFRYLSAMISCPSFLLSKLKFCFKIAVKSRLN